MISGYSTMILCFIYNTPTSTPTPMAFRAGLLRGHPAPTSTPASTYTPTPAPTPTPTPAHSVGVGVGVGVGVN